VLGAACAFSLAAFPLGKQRGSRFALWLSMIVSAFAFAIGFAAKFAQDDWGVFSMADLAAPDLRGIPFAPTAFRRYIYYA
jgi:hypothetical protein